MTFHRQMRRTPTTKTCSGCLLLFGLLAIIVFLPIRCELKTSTGGLPRVADTIRISIETFDPPLVLSQQSELGSLPRLVREVASLQRRIVTTKSWDDYLQLHSSEERKQKENNQDSGEHWEKVLAAGSDKRRTTLFSCVLLTCKNGSVAVVHSMGQSYEGGLSDAPSFPFVAPRGQIFTRKTGWILDDRILKSDFGRMLIQTHPKDLRIHLPALESAANKCRADIERLLSSAR